MSLHGAHVRGISERKSRSAHWREGRFCLGMVRRLARGEEYGDFIFGALG